MNKAFIFDMDGVIINNEIIWHTFESDLLKNILGKELAEKVGDTIGMSIKSTYERAKKFDFSMPYEKFQKIYDDAAFRVYDQAPITPDVEKLVEFLVKKNIPIGLVSSSPRSWIEKVFSKLTFKDDISTILSLNDQNEILHKPHPDGYNAMMKMLDSFPSQTIILEDSNQGISSAKASGAFTIAFTQNLVPGYQQISADAKADTMLEVIEITRKHFKLD